MGIAADRGVYVTLDGRRALAAQQHELDAARQSLQTQKTAWDAEAGERERQNAAAEAEMECLRVEIAAAQAAFADQRQQWESQRTAASTSHSTAAEPLAAQQHDLDAARQSLQAQKAAWDSEAAERERQNTAAEAEMERLRAEIASEKTALAEQRHQWESQRNQADTLQSMSVDQLAARQSELDAAACVLEEQKAAWQTETAAQAHSNATAQSGLESLREESSSRKRLSPNSAASGKHNARKRTTRNRQPPIGSPRQQGELDAGARSSNRNRRLGKHSRPRCSKGWTIASRAWMPCKSIFNRSPPYWKNNNGNGRPNATTPPRHRPKKAAVWLNCKRRLIPGFASLKTARRCWKSSRARPSGRSRTARRNSTACKQISKPGSGKWRSRAARWKPKLLIPRQTIRSSLPS